MYTYKYLYKTLTLQSIRGWNPAASLPPARTPSLFWSCWPLGCTALPAWQCSTQQLLHLCCLGLTHLPQPRSSFCKAHPQHYLGLFVSPQLGYLSFPPCFFSLFSCYRPRNVLTVLSPSSLPDRPTCSPDLPWTLVYFLFLFSLTSPCGCINRHTRL